MTGPWDFSDEPPGRDEESWLQPWEGDEPEWNPEMEGLCGPEYQAYRDELEDEDEEPS